MVERLMYKPAEAFQLAGIGRSKGYQLLASGEWPKVKIGRSIRIPAEALREWINRKLTEQQQQQGGV
jgi:excisionase family DNA binding protein